MTPSKHYGVVYAVLEGDRVVCVTNDFRDYEDTGAYAVAIKNNEVVCIGDKFTEAAGFFRETR